MRSCFVEREKADAPNTAWVTDVTYLPTTEGWLYLSVILDLFSRRVVGYAMSTTIDRALVLESFSKAKRLRPDLRDLVFHSDRGSQFASHEYREALDQARITCSMSRKGNCWDNAVAESFFGTLEIELFYGRPRQSRDATRAAVADYIDGFYNVRRRHSALDYLSPLEYELKPRDGSSGASPPNPCAQQRTISVGCKSPPGSRLSGPVSEPWVSSGTKRPRCPRSCAEPH